MSCAQAHSQTNEQGTQACCLFSQLATPVIKDPDNFKLFLILKQSINQSINIFNVLGGNWDPTDKKFSSVNSYRQDLLPTCKAFPKETTTCIWFTQSHKICNGTTVLQEA